MSSNRFSSNHVNHAFPYTPLNSKSACRPSRRSLSIRKIFTHEEFLEGNCGRGMHARAKRTNRIGSRSSGPLSRYVGLSGSKCLRYWLAELPNPNSGCVAWMIRPRIFLLGGHPLVAEMLSEHLRHD